MLFVFQSQCTAKKGTTHTLAHRIRPESGRSADGASTNKRTNTRTHTHIYIHIYAYISLRYIAERAHRDLCVCLQQNNTHTHNKKRDDVDEFPNKLPRRTLPPPPPPWSRPTPIYCARAHTQAANTNARTHTHTHSYKYTRVIKQLCANVRR